MLLIHPRKSNKYFYCTVRKKLKCATVKEMMSAYIPRLISKQLFRLLQSKMAHAVTYFTDRIRLTPSNAKKYIGYDIEFNSRGSSVVKTILKVSDSGKTVYIDHDDLGGNITIEKRIVNVIINSYISIPTAVHLTIPTTVHLTTPTTVQPIIPPSSYRENEGTSIAPILKSDADKGTNNNIYGLFVIFAFILLSEWYIGVMNSN